MIPKVIHYCWFGGKPKPKLTQRCFKSWKKYCPDFEVKEWNEDNYSIENAPLYVRQAYEEKKWAFVTDYVRLQVIYENGGIYLDTDVELLKPIDHLLEHKGFFGFEDGFYVNTGLGFGAEKGTSFLLQVMEDYSGISFINEDGSHDTLACPRRNTRVFVENGLEQNNRMQTICNNILILPKDYLSPKDWKTGDIHLTENTLSIHHCNASWYTPKMARTLRMRRFKEQIRHTPSNIGTVLIGEENYYRIKEWLLKRR